MVCVVEASTWISMGFFSKAALLAAGHLELAAMLLLDILTAKPALGGLHTRGN